MTNLYKVELHYSVAACETIKFPEGKNWDDVSDISASWGEVTITFKDGTEICEPCELNGEVIDEKSSDEIKVFNTNSNNETDYEIDLNSI